MITLINKTLISASLLTLLCLTTIANAEDKSQKVMPSWDSTGGWGQVVVIEIIFW